MSKKIKINYILPIILTLSVFVFSALACLFGMNEEYAFAELREKEFEVVQKDKLYYCASDYLSGADNIGKLISSMTFLLDGEIIEPPIENTEFVCSGGLYAPGDYKIDVNVNIDGKVYTAENINLKIDKRPVQVEALLNGEREITVAEGEKISVAYNYTGAVPKDTTEETVDGVKVTVINKSKMNTPAYVAYVPDKPTEKYTIVPDYASSDYYSFTYAKSTLTIYENTVSQLIQKNKDTVLVSIIGKFNATYSLNFKDVGISANNEEYAGIKAVTEKEYGAGDFFKKNEALACYKVNLIKEGKTQEEKTSAFVKIKVDKTVTRKESYKVIAVYDSGSTEILDAIVSEDGYLVFNTNDMGSFVVTAPIEGLNLTDYVIAIVAGVVVIMLVILFVTIFRRKY